MSACILVCKRSIKKILKTKKNLFWKRPLWKLKTRLKSVCVWEVCVASEHWRFEKLSKVFLAFSDNSTSIALPYFDPLYVVPEAHCNESRDQLNCLGIFSRTIIYEQRKGDFRSWDISGQFLERFWSFSNLYSADEGTIKKQSKTFKNRPHALLRTFHPRTFNQA